VIGDSSQQGTMVTRCFRCQGFGHFAAQCPTRTLLVEEALDEDGHKYTKEVFDLEDGASDAEELIRACSVRLNVFRCFFPYLEIRIGVGLACSIPISNIMTSYKVMIDEGSCVNIIAKSVVDRRNLKLNLLRIHIT